ncbi:MAG: hypothetical protein ACXVJT_17960 [Thermoanaerobaculia bacterium]
MREKQIENESKRITLIARPAGLADRTWRLPPGSEKRLMVIAPTRGLRHTLVNWVLKSDYDVERVIIDRAVTHEGFLELLAAVPDEFIGDLLMIDEERRGYLSSSCRGGDRVIYRLSEEDVDFYFDSHEVYAA